ncbi:GGDEF domain-containing protein [Burkholderiaceae bacterium DAT-1]|nr:GGDEF domain-containing protein [Burkholderiaceae bacterium DAT-1]
MEIPHSAFFWTMAAVWLAVIGFIIHTRFARIKLPSSGQALLLIVALNAVCGLTESLYPLHSEFTDASGAALLSPRVMNLVSAILMFSLLVFYWRPKAIAERAQQVTQSGRDIGTGLFNLQRFGEIGEYEVERSNRYNRPLSLVILDVDHAGQLNDAHGRAATDRIISQIGKLCLATCRDTDIPARLNSKSFALLLPESSLENAIACAERLRKEIIQSPFSTSEGDVLATISAGVCQRQTGETLAPMLARAESALTAAKQNGRNRVHAT